jgi:hypothetical protein
MPHTPLAKPSHWRWSDWQPDLTIPTDNKLLLLCSVACWQAHAVDPQEIKSVSHQGWQTPTTRAQQHTAHTCTNQPCCCCCCNPFAAARNSCNSGGSEPAANCPQRLPMQAQADAMIVKLLQRTAAAALAPTSSLLLYAVCAGAAAEPAAAFPAKCCCCCCGC